MRKQHPITRRSFLGQTALGAAATPLVLSTTSLAAQEKPAPSERITLGVIHLYESNNHYRNFIDCVFARKPTAAPAEVAHRSITICHLGNIAMRLGRESLKWDPEKEGILNDPEASKMLSREYRAPWKLEM